MTTVVNIIQKNIPEVYYIIILPLPIMIKEWVSFFLGSLGNELEQGTNKSSEHTSNKDPS